MTSLWSSSFLLSPNENLSRLQYSEWHQPHSTIPLVGRLFFIVSKTDCFVTDYFTTTWFSSLDEAALSATLCRNNVTPIIKHRIEIVCWLCAMQKSNEERLNHTMFSAIIEPIAKHRWAALYWYKSCLQEVLNMRRRRVQSKRLNNTVAAIRRKRKLTCMKKKVSSRNRVFVHLVNH